MFMKFFTFSPDVREFLSLDHPKNAPVKIDEVEEAANEGTEGKVDELVSYSDCASHLRLRNENVDLK